MRLLRTTWGIRLVTASLLFSTLSLVVSSYAGFSVEEPIDGYADWVRKQLGGETTDLIEQAIQTALAADAHNLTHFLEAFLDAYAQAVQAKEGPAISETTLFALLNSRYLQLVGKPIAPLLLLKSLSVRSFTSSERTAAHLFALFKNRIDARIEGETIVHSLFSKGRFIHLISATINPRGP